MSICPNDGEVLVEDAASLVGATLDGLYRVEELLGRGGMGAVYRARHVVLQDLVAIKVLSGGVSSRHDWLRRFVREGQAARAIQHPNVVAVYDLRTSSDGIIYMVQEYVHGHTLRAELERRTRLPAAEALEVLAPIADALDVAHASGVVHRDLKPENVMIGASAGRTAVKLLDLGIAKLREIASTEGASPALTQPGQIIGTPPYMSPEQWGEIPHDGILEIDQRADVYSLGVLVYEMVSGRRPFRGATLQELRRAHVLTTPALVHELVEDLTEAFGRAVARALSKDRSSRQLTAGQFVAELRGGLGDASLPTVTVAKPGRPLEADAPVARVALLYKRNAEPDEQLLRVLETRLRGHGYHVFIDRHLAVGVEWAREIERQVRGADAVIILLSAASVSSEMLAYEVQVAREAAQERRGKPRLLPVRVNYPGPLPEPLAGHLDAIQYAAWNGPQDTPALVAQVLDALRAPEAPQPIITRETLEPEGGAVPLESEFYIVRPADEEFRTAIARQDSVVLVKGARQMGKTSLLARGLQQARNSGAKVVLTDFQKLNAAHFESIGAFLITLGELIADQLDLDVYPGDVWESRRGANVNFERYLRREVLAKVASPIVWGLDEVDRLFTYAFAGEVFGLFRSWHNERSLDPAAPWRRLTLAIAYATEAHLFITDINQSPFNVGTRLVLDDFTLEQVAELNRRHGSPLRGMEEVARYFRLMGGQPHLVRRGLYEMAVRGRELAAFEAHADRDEGPFGDHLRRILVALAQDPMLCEVMRGVLRGRSCPTAESFYRLRSAGVVTGESARDARPRCLLYAAYLKRHLLG